MYNLHSAEIDRKPNFRADSSYSYATTDLGSSDPFLEKRQHVLIISYNLGHSNIIHCFSSATHLLWRHPLAKHPTSLFMSAELVHKLYLKSRGKLRMHCLLHTRFR